MTPRSEPKKHGVVKQYLVPHEGNRYHPKLFRTAAVVGLVLAIAVFEGGYLVNTKLVRDNTSFLASVLPAALLDLTNADRAASGVAPLKNDPLLAQAAQLKANDMAEKGYFAHVSPDGKTPWHWLDQVGYSYTFAGENLAINFDDSSAVEEAWMNSPTHHANLVKPQYTRVGYAVAKGMYEGKETTFVVQEFATNPVDQTVSSEVKPKNPIVKAVEKAIETVKPEEKPTESLPAPVETVASTSLPQQPEPAIASSESASSTPVVLGTASGETTRDSAFANTLKAAAASPTFTSTLLLGLLALILSILLIGALLAHKSVKFLEVLGGGLCVIVIALGVLVFNASHSATPTLPSGESSAVKVSSR